MVNEKETYYIVECPRHGVHFCHDIRRICKNTNPYIPGSYGLPGTCPDCDWERGMFTKRPKPKVYLLTKEEYEKGLSDDEYIHKTGHALNTVHATAYPEI